MLDQSISPGSWEAWSARPELMPKVQADEPCWSAEADRAPSCQGGWDLHWYHVDPGRWYRVEFLCRTIDIPHVHDNVHCEVIWWRSDNTRADWSHVRFERIERDTYEFAHEGRAPADAERMTLRLMLRWTDQGKAVWCDPRLLPIEAPPPRTLKAAIATGAFPGTSVEDNLSLARRLVAQAADAGAAVVCLPECITSWRGKELPQEGARPIPGAETKALCRDASRLGIDIVCSMNELNGKLIHNTGLYIDAEKGILGKYRKVHLAVGEHWRGITPGSEFPVWQARYGKVGMLICYDNVMGEGHRVLAQRGAEVLFMPIMGDPRAVGDRAHENWRHIMRVRAMDNHVWFVVCQNRGEWGLIVRPDGEITAEVSPGNGIALAELDLDFRFNSWIGSDFANRYWGERRPHLYSELLKEV